MYENIENITTVMLATLGVSGEIKNFTTFTDSLSEFNDSVSDAVSNTSVRPPFPAYVDQTIYATNTVLLPMVLIFGILGNIISVIVLSQRKMRTSTTLFLIALAASDMLLLLMQIPVMPHLNHSRTMFYRYMIIARYVFSNVFITCTSWLTVAVTIERFIAIKFTLRARLICTISRAKKAIAAIFITSCLFHISKFFEYMVNPDMNSPSPVLTTWLGQNQAYETYLFSVNISLAVIIPFLSLIIINILLIVGLVSHNAEMRQTIQSSSSRRDMVQITVVVITMVTVFISCHAIGVYLALMISVIGRNAAFAVPINTALRFINNLLVLVNSSVNFVLYSIISQRFRKMAKEVFYNSLCCKVAGKKGSPHGSSRLTSMTNSSSMQKEGKKLMPI